MKCFVAYCYDRHIDPVVRVFLDLPSAILWVNDWMEEYVARPDNLIEQPLAAGYAYYLTYGEEEDHAFVMETEMPGRS